MPESSSPEEMNILSEIQNEGAVHSKLVNQIEEITRRTLISYITNFGHPAGSMAPEDDKVLETLLRSISIDKFDGKLDLMISSPGGLVEAADRVWQTLRTYCKSLRVIIPKTAMSAATLLAFGADSLLMSESSELGPVDPQLVIGTPPKMQAAAIVVSAFENLLAELEITDPRSPKVAGLVNQLSKIDPLVVQSARNATKFSEELACKMLKNGLLRGSDESKITEIANKFIKHGVDLSHGTSIRYPLLVEWGIDPVEIIPLDSELWALLWELFMRCDRSVSQQVNAGKYFVGRSGTVTMRAHIVQL